MSARRLVVGGLGVVALLVVLGASGGQSDPYKVRFQLTTANGLREGSPIKVGGVEVGKIESLELGPDDYPVAEAELDPDKDGARVGRGASARIVTTNLLGSKLLQLEPGEGRLPSGTLIPRSRISTPVDLDQVLGVLDADTRTRLQILINEAGLAMTGRRADFNQTLKVMPKNLRTATKLLNQLVGDNHTLRQTVEASSGFVSRIARERRELSRVVGDAGQTMEAVAQKRDRLRETLARAPGTLTTLQRFLADLGATTRPLGPAARALTASAPGLAALLAELGPVQRAADPAFRQAIAVAPSLTRLADGATPVLQRATPTLRSLAEFSRAAVPLSRTVDVSVDDLLGLVEGWARAIQDRDGVGHVFHGKATLSPDLIRALVNGPPSATKRSRGARRSGSRGRTQPEARSGRQDGGARTPEVSIPASPRDLDQITGRIPQLRPLPSTQAPSAGGDDARAVLDYLLGP